MMMTFLKTAAMAVVALFLAGCKYETVQDWPVMDLDELRASGDAWPDTREETFAVMDGVDEERIVELSFDYAELNTTTGILEDWSDQLRMMKKAELFGFLYCSLYCLSYNEGCRLNGIDKVAHPAVGRVTLLGINVHPRLTKLGMDPLPYIVYEDDIGERRVKVPRKGLTFLVDVFGDSVNQD